jgi:hypothetical protein
MYGQMQSDKIAEENLTCRKIVKEINNFGISQRQTLFVMYLLASELECGEHMQAITQLIRELGGNELFLIGHSPDEGGQDGKINV